MIVYGANVGSSMLTLALTMSLRGQAKQIAMYQTSYNVLGAVILVPLLYVEVWTGAPLMLALLEAISDDPATRVAVAFLLFNVVPGLLLLPIVRPTGRSEGGRVGTKWVRKGRT